MKKLQNKNTFSSKFDDSSVCSGDFMYKKNLFQVDGTNFYKWTHFSSDQISDAREALIRAGLEIAVKVIAFAAVVKSGVAVHAQEVSLTVAGFLVESVFLEAESLDFGVFGTGEAQVAGGVAIRHYIRPVAVIRFRAECQTFGALEQIATAVHAIQKLVALVGRAPHSKVSELMRAIIGWVGWLKGRNGQLNLR